MALLSALLAFLLAAPAAASEHAWLGDTGNALARTALQARGALGADAGFERIFRDDGAPSADKATESLDMARLRVTGQRVYTLIGGVSGAPDIELTVLLDQRSSWNGALGRFKLKEGLLESATIFASCGVNLRSAYVVEAWLDDALRDAFIPGATSPYRPLPEVAVATRVAVPARPLVLLMEQGGVRAFNQASTTQLARSNPENRHLLDVATLAWSVAHDYEQRFFVQPSYSLLAHELAHLLGNFGHVDSPVPNLMNSYEGRTPQESGLAKTGDLLDWQCAAIRAYGTRAAAPTLSAGAAPQPPLSAAELRRLLDSLEH